jgi:DNA (cytosine-5)-methyltransferase 1
VNLANNKSKKQSSAEICQFKFVDLFAGIGGIRKAFETTGGKCVFTSEWDSYSQKTYLENFEVSHQIAGDITKVHEAEIPPHDLLLAGFPCQPFSLAGVSKKNALGRAHGFHDVTQGTLFFDVARVIAFGAPRVFVLENVKNLMSHDKGNTFKVILNTLTEELGYQVFYKVIDAAYFVPQHRERIIIIGFKEKVNFSWDQVEIPYAKSRLLGEILHKKNHEPYIETDAERFYSHSDRQVLKKYTLSDKLWSYLQNYKSKHQAAGNGFGYSLVNESSISRTLSARYYKDGSEILIDQGPRINPRRLTPRECARLMGFPDSFKISVSDTRAYKQFGNSVVVPVFESIAKGVIPYLQA